MSSDSKFTSMTMNFGLALIMIGVIGFSLAGGSSVTALIPAAFGIIEIILAKLARSRPNLKKHLMHVALLLAIVLLIATVRGVPQLAKLLQGAELDRPEAIMSMAVTSIISFLYLLFGIRSFIAARKG